MMKRQSFTIAANAPEERQHVALNDARLVVGFRSGYFPSPRPVSELCEDALMLFAALRRNLGVFCDHAHTA
jgi:hypothetical protein